MQKKLFEPGKFVKKKEQVIIKSIKPKYVKPILNKTKKYEFMKVIFNDRDCEIIIYASRPTKRFVASFTPGRIFHETPKKIWDFFKDDSGMTEAEFFEYYKDHEMGYAVEINDLNIFRKKIDPRQIFENFHAPQSFCYADRNKFFLQKINWEKIKKMEFNSLTDSESNAMVFLYHLLDRSSEHYSKFARIESVNNVITKIIKIQSRIRKHKYDMTDIEILRNICSTFKFWDGHHYFIYLTCQIIDFLEEKLKEKTKPRCKKCGGELSLWKVGNPIECMTIFCYKCTSEQFSIPYEEVMQLIYKKYEEAN